MNTLLLNAPPQLSASFADVDFQEGLGLILFIFGLIVHIGFAVAVHSDAKEIQGTAERRLFGSPFLWTVATLFIGVFGAVAYWLVHRSAINHDSPLNERS